MLCWLERAGVKLDTEKLAEIAAEVGRARDPRATGMGPVRGGIHARIAAATSRILFDKLGLSKK